MVPAPESKGPHKAGKLLPRNAAAEDLRLDNMLAAKYAPPHMLTAAPCVVSTDCLELGFTSAICLLFRSRPC